MPTRRADHRPDLDALRGAAVLLVVGYHAGVRGLAGGFVGVDVFFVLSGFLATRLLAREYATDGRLALAAGYGRRALRLLPALLAMVVATLAATWLVVAPIDRARVATMARAAVLGDANHALARASVDYFGRTDSPFLHTWTLGVELQASLLWPLLFLACAAVGVRASAARRVRLGRDDLVERRVDALAVGVAPGLLALAALSFATALVLTRTAPVWAFYGTAARLWEFAVGGLLALVLPVAPRDDAPRRGWWAGVGLALLAVAVATYDGEMAYPGMAALLPVAGTALVVVGGARGGGPLAGETGPLRALRALGGLSYAWFLWHWPLVSLGGALAPALGVGGKVAWSLAALLPAWATQRWIEAPARATRDDAGAGRRALVVGAAAVAVALATVALERAARDAALAPAQRPFAAARGDHVEHACWNRIPTDRDACVFGDPRGRATVALVGDSHAEHWLAALDRLGRARGWRVVLLVRGGCPVAEVEELYPARQARRDAACLAHRAAAMRRLLALRPTLAVLSSYDAYVERDGNPRGRVSPDAWRRGLLRSYGRLSAAGIPVVALRDTPDPAFDVPACLSRAAAAMPGARDCTYALAPSLHAAARAAQRDAVDALAARGRPVRVVEMADAVCGAERVCAPMRAGAIAFGDDDHLTASVARVLAPVLGARLDGAAASMSVRLP